MTNSSNLNVGMDVHKDSVDIALADGDGRQEVRHYGSVGGDLTALDQAVRKLQATGKTLRFVYEAGPCGYLTRGLLLPCPSLQSPYLTVRATV